MSNQKLFAKTAIGQVTTGNSSMTGVGAVEIYAVGAGEVAGSTISSIAIKAVGSTTNGMVRIFIQTGGENTLLFECAIPGNVQSGAEPALGLVIPLNLVLAPSASILATTQNSETFNIIISATEWENCPC